MQLETADKTSIIHSPEKLKHIATVLKVIAHPLRLAIIQLLDKNERIMVSEIWEYLAAEQSLVSHHLQNMRTNGILQVEREGRSMYYSLKERGILRIVECIESCQFES